MNRTFSSFAPCLLALLLLGAAATVPVAGAAPSATPLAAQSASAEPPQAVAGLDQTVERNASVLLDATQSFSPDGELVAYEWEITSPSGASVDPTCDSTDCGLAHFRAPELGEYTVTVTVTDDEGLEATDTLYVTAVPRGDFGVELSGPASASDGDEANLTATISPGASVVENVTWYRGDQAIGNQSVPELGGVFNHSALIVPGATYRAVVADQWNQTVSDTWNASGSSSSWTPSTPETDEYPRIEGPAVVTGSPDAKSPGAWFYENVKYVVRTDDSGSTTDSMWTTEYGGYPFATDEDNININLEAGITTIYANLEITSEELGESQSPTMYSSTFSDRVISGPETVLTRHVIVDPSPEIQHFDVSHDDNDIHLEYEIADEYNPPETIEILVDGDVVKTVSPDYYPYTGLSEIEAQNYNGDTKVRIVAEDSRGQVASKSSNIYIPNTSQEAISDQVESYTNTLSEIIDEVVPSGIFNEINGSAEI